MKGVGSFAVPSSQFDRVYKLYGVWHFGACDFAVGVGFDGLGRCQCNTVAPNGGRNVNMSPGCANVHLEGAFNIALFVTDVLFLLYLVLRILLYLVLRVIGSYCLQESFEKEKKLMPFAPAVRGQSPKFMGRPGGFQNFGSCFGGVLTKGSTSHNTGSPILKADIRVLSVSSLRMSVSGLIGGNGVRRL